jgi:hypothetical protein
MVNGFFVAGAVMGVNVIATLDALNAFTARF